MVKDHTSTPVERKPCVDAQFRAGPEWCALAEVDLRVLEQAVVCQAHVPGEVLFYEGAVCKGVYFVKSGLIGVRKADPDGNSTLLKLAYPEDTLGYRPFLAGESHRGTAEVLKPSTVCFIGAETMRTIILRNPAVGLKFLQRAAKALGDAEERFHQSVTLSVRARFAHLLLVFNEHCGIEMGDGSIALELPVSRSDLAAMLGVRRESISRVIHELQESGIARFTGPSVHVLKVNKLIGEFRPEARP